MSIKSFKFQQDPNRDQLIVVENYDLDANQKIESLFSQSNGRIGIRGTQDFACLNRKPGFYLAGFYHQAAPDELDELVNLPDLTQFEIRLNGHQLSLENKAQLEDYFRSFNLNTNEIITRCVFSITQNCSLHLEISRFLSYADKSIFCQRIKLCVSGNTSPTVVVQTGIDGQASNEGVSHLQNIQFRLIQNVQLMEASVAGKNLLILSCFQPPNEIGRTKTLLSRRRISTQFEFQPIPGEEYIFTKTSRVLVPQNKLSTEPEILRSVEDFNCVVSPDYPQLLEESRQSVLPLLTMGEINIEGVSEEENGLIRFARHHSIGLIPDRTQSYSIAGKGLTGEGYHGHVFWDTELYLLPFLTNVSPEAAANLLRFRHTGLEGARKKAKQFHYQGALYAWEVTTPEGDEKTPPSAQLNIHTGKANPVWSAIKEHHISADIPYAIQQYLNTTGNNKLLKQELLPVVIETAIFWCSRATFSETDQQYHIRDVIGPDEYTEHVDDNAYTNYMAWNNVAYALQVINELLSEDSQGDIQWAREYNLRELQARFDHFLTNLYLPKPNAQQIIPQDSTFLSKPLLENLEKYRESAIKQTILLDYSRDEIVNHQVLKQADEVMLQVLLPDLFNLSVKRANLDYYEPKTVHDSSLSPSIHAIAYADVGNLEKADEYFRKSLEIDVNDHLQDSTDGLHAASLGGVWLVLIRGFAGIRPCPNWLQIDPHLPAHWKRMRFLYQYQNQLLQFDITHDQIQLTNVSPSTSPASPKLVVRIGGEEYTVHGKICVQF